MTKKHQREEDYVEKLEKELREAKSVIRSLTNRIKKLDKNYKADLEEARKEKHLFDDAPKPPGCEVCGKGQIKTFELGKWLFLSCSICEFKEKVAK